MAKKRNLMEVAPIPAKVAGPQNALNVLRRCPVEIRIDAARELLPDGYVISSPKRESAIRVMENVFEAWATRPTQYGPYAERPDPESECPE